MTAPSIRQFRPSNLPLPRPFRTLPGGDILANAMDPLMTDLVNAGYNDGLGVENDPVLGTPQQYRTNPTVPQADGSRSRRSRRWTQAMQDSAQDGATAGAQSRRLQNFANPGELHHQAPWRSGRAAVPVDADQLVGSRRTA